MNIDKNSNIRRAVGPIGCLFLLISGCLGENSAPPDLRQAANVIGYDLRATNLARSAYSVTCPNGKPSDWVSFRFSTLGAAELPYTEEEAEQNPEIREEARSISRPLLPKGVRFIEGSVDLNAGRQLVIRSDDTARKIIVDGYTDPGKSPVLTRAFDLPVVTPAPGVREMYQSNLDQGVNVRR